MVIVPDRVLDEVADELRQQGRFSEYPAVRDAAVDPDPVRLSLSLDVT
jgi:hypothetical protein